MAKTFYPEIQGIRALSILAVICFHLSAQALPGGYVGVDMFFVLSGFLIIRMIATEIEAGSFSVVRFYKNRVVRLLPNLFLMIAASLLISYWVLKPYDFMQYAKSLQFSAIYVTNMVFAKQQGYFDLSREAKPLLHTWSLSIEEQFYLIFPVLLILLYKLRTQKFLILTIIALASFWVRFWYIEHHQPTHGFFSFFGRVWEFIIGGAAAMASDSLKKSLYGNEHLSLFGLVLMLLSLFFLDEGLAYSGLLLVVPCLATALVILSSTGTRTGKMLGGKHLVFIGGLSYSLYLWHWPLLSWLRNADYGIGLVAQNLILLAATLLVSFIAWKYVEEPCRRNRDKFSGKTVAAFTFTFAVFCISFGSYIYAQEGMESRFPNWVKVRKNLEQFDFAAATGVKVDYPAACFIGNDPGAILANCSFGKADAREKILLIGDSHSFVWYPAFLAAIQKTDYQGVLVVLPGCPPLFEIASYDGAKNICIEGFDENIGNLLKAQKFKKVFLVAHWSMYSEGEPEKQPNHFISDATTNSYEAQSSKSVLTRALENTIRRFNENGTQVVIVHSVPVLPKTIQSLPEDFTTTLSAYQNQNRFMTEFVDAHQGSFSLATIDPTGAFCANQLCISRAEGNVLYSDNNHISQAGAARLVGLVGEAM